MKYTDLPGINKKGSLMVYGTSNDRFLYGKNADDLLNQVIDSGVNIIDTARRYMKAERVLGEYIERTNTRNKLIIISKCAHPSLLGRSRLNEKDIRNDLNKSLEELRTSYIDIFLMHRDDKKVPASIIVNLFNQLIKEEKIKAYGCSNFSLSRIKEINTYAKEHNLVPMQYSSPNYSLVEQVNEIWKDTTSIQGEKHAEERQYYHDNGMVILAYSSLALGFLSGKIASNDKWNLKGKLSPLSIKGFESEENYQRLEKAEELAKKKNCTVAQISLAYLLHQDNIVLPIVSAQNKKRIKENFDSINVFLTNKDINYLDLH